jgi:phosphomannomutase/phosphoglucomutase
MILEHENIATSLRVESPWKACDLRGIYPSEIFPLLYQDIGSAIGSMLAFSSSVVVCGDFRLSTPALKQALIEGLVHTGVTVLDAGQGPTPLAYFTAKMLQADAVLIVTASHNPAQHNGLKLMLGSSPTTPEQFRQIREATESRKFRSGEGRLKEVNLVRLYTQTLMKPWVHLEAKNFGCIVLDAGSGAMSQIAPQVISGLGFAVECISCTIDGSFPNRPSDCSRTANLAALRTAISARRNSLGIAWDGDGDRVAFVDEEGKHVSTDEISVLFARHILRQAASAQPNKKIVVDIKLSDIVRIEIERSAGTALLERTGHAFMRRRMVAEDALLGLDACGHYFFHELSGGDDGLYAALFMLDMLQTNGMSLVELRRTLPPIFSTPELRIPKEYISYADALAKLCTEFSDSQFVQIDGTRFALPDGTVLIRESGTEPVLSLRIEGFDRQGLTRITERCLAILPASALLRRQLDENAQP